MKGRFAVLAAGVIAGGLTLTGCTSRSNEANVTSGPHGPTSPATSGNYGNKVDLAPPYGGTKHAQPDAQSAPGSPYPEMAKVKRLTSSKAHPYAPKPENHTAPTADHGE